MPHKTKTTVFVMDPVTNHFNQNEEWMYNVKSRSRDQLVPLCSLGKVNNNLFDTTPGASLAPVFFAGVTSGIVLVAGLSITWSLTDNRTPTITEGGR